MWGLSTKIGMGPPPNPLTSKQIFGQQTIFAETFLCQTTFLHRAVFNAVQREFFEAIVLCCLSTSSIPPTISQFWPFKKKTAKLIHWTICCPITPFFNQKLIFLFWQKSWDEQIWTRTTAQKFRLQWKVQARASLIRTSRPQQDSGGRKGRSEASPPS